MSGYSFTFTSSMKATLEADYDNLGNNNPQQGAGYQTHEDILTDISQQGIISYTPQGYPVYGAVPAQGVDPAVWDWFTGAATVNQNSGFAGEFIVDYTVDQYNLRTTGSNPYTDNNFYIASNNLAASVLFNAFGTGILQTGTLPSLSTIGTFDSGQAALRVFLPIYGGSDAAGWAGTLLFPFLGDGSYFDNLFANPSTVTNDSHGLDKLNPGMYDLVAALDAQQQASVQAGLSDPLGAFENLYDPIYANVPNYQDTIQNAINAANTAFSSYYDLAPNNDFMPGDDLVFNGLASLFTATDWVVGDAVQSENIPTSGITSGPLTQNAVIVGGPGNNTIVAPMLRTDLIDGGSGYSPTINNGWNTLDLSGIYSAITIQSIHDPYNTLSSQLVTTSFAQNQLSISTQGVITEHSGVPPVNIDAYDFSELILNASEATTFITSDNQTLSLLTHGSDIDPIMVFVSGSSEGFTGTNANEIFVVSGKSDILTAGGSDQTFIALSGSDVTFSAKNEDSVTDIALDGTGGTDDIFTGLSA